MFDELVREIEEAYGALGHTIGWRFITSPRCTLSPETDVVFVTLNPGGNRDRPDHPSVSCEQGSAYVLESWSNSPPGCSKLQVQVRTLFKYLGAQPDEVLGGQLVPFRSPNWEALPRRDESLRFGIEIWRRVLEYVRPTLIVAMGKTVLRPSLHEILGAPVSTDNVPVEWGNLTATSDCYKDTRLVTLPHLSRFGIMTREASRPAIERLLAPAFGT